MTVAQTAWGSLAAQTQLPGGMLYFNASNLQEVDQDNLYWDYVNKRMSVAVAGDRTGTDTINIYKQGDSYLANGQISGYVNTPGWTVSSSRGTGLIPTTVQSGDFLGKFAGFGYTTTGATYQEFASIYSWANGNTAGNPGGLMSFNVKADNGIAVERGSISNVGAWTVGGTVAAANVLTVIPTVPTGGVVTLAATGIDASIGFAFNTKLTGITTFSSQAGTSPEFVIAASGLINTAYWNIVGSTTVPTLSTQGAIADISGQILSKGVAPLYLGTTSAGGMVAITNTAGSVNQMTLTGAATGGRVTISSQGSDTNTGITLAQKGTAVMQFTGQTVGTAVGAAGGATALPATPLGYITVSVNALGNVRIPYYN